MILMMADDGLLMVNGWFLQGYWMANYGETGGEPMVNPQNPSAAEVPDLPMQVWRFVLEVTQNGHI